MAAPTTIHKAETTELSRARLRPLLALLGVLRNKKVAFGFSLLAVLVLAAALAPLIAPYDPDKQILEEILMPPFSQGERGLHVLGTDQLGRDLLSRIMWGGRVSLVVGVLAVLGSGTIGVVAGLLSGLHGGWLDAVLMRLGEIQLSFPSLLIIFVVLAIVGPSVISIAIVLSITGWVQYARLTRGKVFSEKEKEYVLAQYAIGASNLRIMLVHLLPNILPVIVVFATLQLGLMIIMESGLSFLGIGVQPPTSSWGRMLSDGRNYIAIAWWVSTLPGLAIVTVVLGINFAGDGLREYVGLE